MINQQTSTRKIVSFHILFWIIYVLSEYIANYPHLQGTEHIRQLWSVALALPILMLPTYLIVLIGVPRYLSKGKTATFILVLILSAVFVFYGRIKWLELVNYLVNDFIGPMPAAKVLKNVVRDYAIIALAIAIYIIADWRRKELINNYLLEAKANSDLELLKRQLHPHFLFNTLNNIYSLSLKNSDHTGDQILKLSNLLEYLVYQSGEKKVLLIDEIELVKNYIDLEKLRYGSELNININIDGLDSKTKTAPLILLPFVENCFKHGSKNEKGVFWIKIKISLHKNLLVVFVENSKNKSPREPQEKPSGIGLANITERLELLYPGKHILTAEDSLAFFSVKLELKL